LTGDVTIILVISGHGHGSRRLGAAYCVSDCSICVLLLLSFMVV
jgi:hypothetical protein